MLIILFIWLACGMYAAYKDMSDCEHIDADVVSMATLLLVGGVVSVIIYYCLNFLEWLDTHKIKNPFYKGK